MGAIYLGVRSQGRDVAGMFLSAHTTGTEVSQEWIVDGRGVNDNWNKRYMCSNFDGRMMMQKREVKSPLKSGMNAMTRSTQALTTVGASRPRD